METVRGMGTFITKNSESVEQIRTKMAEESIDRFVTEMLSLGMGGEQILKLVKDRVQDHQSQRGETV